MPDGRRNRHLAYKEALTDIEARSPGAKFAFYHEFLAKAADRFDDDETTGRDGLRNLRALRFSSESEVCAFCRLAERASSAQPVELISKRAS